MSNRSIWNVLLGLLAACTLVFGAVLAITPESLPTPVLEQITEVEQASNPQDVIMAISGVVGLFALWRTYFSGATDADSAGDSSPIHTDEPNAHRTETGTGRSRIHSSRNRQSDSEPPVGRIVGGETTARVEETLHALKHGHKRPEQTAVIVDDLRQSVRTIEAAQGCGEQADERIRRGEWTTDRIAATFLGDASAGRLSLWHRLRRWLFPGRTFERRLERTVDEIERHALEFDSSEVSPVDGAGGEYGDGGGAGDSDDTGASASAGAGDGDDVGVGVGVSAGTGTADESVTEDNTSGTDDRDATEGGEKDGNRDSESEPAAERTEVTHA
ncbi:hypothetical protein C483_09816 [Natrialba hulunbeirensis JCM 10989]|uniref:Uncharacterized protein n=1 Tax=Natrialba hulunbeirensis JCM 10989 TaxID=1227493 RepID=M0A0G5_9EURY|nr:hypothetical protein [Natrialba hulunbeirensis]ELY91327.1 hypothetical protein C483_09816 [Natrialba hulunbeirensis JCM 10989]